MKTCQVACAGAAEAVKGREGDTKGANEGEPSGTEKGVVDLREVARVDQIFSAVFSKVRCEGNDR